MLRRKSIEISDGNNTVKLLPGIEFETEQRRVGKKQTMASGLTVVDIAGYKNILTIPTGWLYPRQLDALIDMIKKNPYLTVKYPYLMEWREEIFLFEMPKLKAFRYDERGAECLGVTLEAEQAEVFTVETDGSGT